MNGQYKGDKRPKLVRFGETSVQTGRRVAIPSVLLENAGLHEGDTVTLYFEIGGEDGQTAVVVMKSKNSGTSKHRGRKAG